MSHSPSPQFVHTRAAIATGGTSNAHTSTPTPQVLNTQHIVSILPWSTTKPNPHEFRTLVVLDRRVYRDTNLLSPLSVDEWATLLACPALQGGC